MIFLSKKRNIFAAVESFGKHIEALLQEHDCVVLPSFGAFIAHTKPAYYVDDECSFYPPSRSLCFNKELTSDDGLLTSYFMQKNGISFSEARTVVNTLVDRLRDTLSIDGAIRLSGIGRLRQDLAGNIHFESAPENLASPSYFGFDALTVRDLTALENAKQGSLSAESRPTKIITTTERTIDIHVGRQTLRQILSAAAVLLLLIVFSLPVSDGKYTDIASLGITTTNPPSLEEATTTEETLEAEENFEAEVTKENNETTIPDAATNLNEDSKLSQIVPQKPVGSRVYHVIVGSLPSQKGADALVQKYIDKGFAQTKTVASDDRVRISIASFTDKAEGEAYVQSLRQDDAFKHVWLLSVKAK